METPQEQEQLKKNLRKTMSKKGDDMQTGLAHLGFRPATAPCDLTRTTFMVDEDASSTRLGRPSILLVLQTRRTW
jgi:hypothetical protein